MKNKHYILLCIGYFVYMLYRLYWFGGTDGRSVYQSLVYIFGTVNFAAENMFIWNAALWMIPQLLVIAVCTEYFEHRLMSNAPLLFTRTNDREKLVFRSAFRLAGKAAVLVMAEVLAAFIAGLAGGASFSGFGWQAFIETGNIIGSMTGCILLINVLTLFVDSIYALMIFLFVEWIQLFVVRAYHSVGNFMPVTGLLQELRTDSSICGSLTVLVCVTLWNVGIVCLGACLFHKKKDIL